MKCRPGAVRGVWVEVERASILLLLRLFFLHYGVRRRIIIIIRKVGWALARPESSGVILSYKSSSRFSPFIPSLSSTLVHSFFVLDFPSVHVSPPSSTRSFNPSLVLCSRVLQGASRISPSNPPSLVFFAGSSKQSFYHSLRQKEKDIYLESYGSRLSLSHAHLIQRLIGTVL